MPLRINNGPCSRREVGGHSASSAVTWTLIATAYGFGNFRRTTEICTDIGWEETVVCRNVSHAN